jgi:repressor LexA
MKLHEAQEKLIQILKNNIEEPLTIRELQEELKASSTSVVFHHINQLEKKGYLRRNPNNPKDYQILSDNPEKSVAYLNLYGLAQCGPNGSILDGNPLDRIPLASRLLGFSMQDAFLVKAKGDSMEPKIHDSDLIIAKKTDVASNGDLVVCVNNGEALIKKYQKESQPILVSLNSKYSPFIAAEDFRIEGIVRGIFSNKV